MFLTYAPISHNYSLSLHDALPISQEPEDHDRDRARGRAFGRADGGAARARVHASAPRGRPALHADDVSQPLDRGDRKSTRLNSSHTEISYAVFCCNNKSLESSDKD